MNEPDFMTAAVTHGHGGPEQITVHRDWPRPVPRAGEALVRVTAAALNNTDIWSRNGSYGTATDPDAVVGWKGVALDFPRIQGIDVAGEVIEVGSGANNRWRGRRVIVDPIARYRNGFADQIIGSELDGGFAEFIVCTESQLHDVTGSPSSDHQLACLPTAYGTAMGMIAKAACEPGERVLVTGASGGVGMAALQLLVNRGCHVIAHTSAPHAELIASLGAAEVSVRGSGSLETLEPVDAVIDVVGGEEFATVFDRLRDGGRLATAGAIAGPIVPFDLRRLYLGQRTLIGSTMHTSEQFSELARVAVAGGVAPLVAEVYPLTEIAAAQERFLAKDFVGKLVLEP